MKTVTYWNWGLLVVSVFASTAVAWAPRLRMKTLSAEVASASSPPKTLVDHGGVELPLARYSRIASVSTIADAILWELCEPDRVMNVTGYSARSSTKSYRFSGKPTLENAQDLETLLVLRPDLVLVSSFGDERPIARMRDAGLRVFDLGAMRGLSTLVPNIHEIAALVGHPERGDRVAQALVSEMSAVAIDVPFAARKRGIYLSVYGGHLFGGGQGTSYHDVITSAGLIDATGSAYRDWPEYSVEQVIMMDPDVIVTNAGMRDRICQHAGLSGLRACASASAIATLEDGLLGDPGPAMLDAAQAIRRDVYGSPPTELTTKEREP